MRYLRKYNEAKRDVKDLDWSFIKDCLLETFDSVNTKVVFYFYACNFNMGKKDSWHYYKYSGSSFGYGNSRITDIFTYDPETDKRENQPEDGDLFLVRYPEGSGLWGIEFKFELESFDIVKEGRPSDVTNYFEKCLSLSQNLESAIDRINDKYDYRIGLQQSLYSVGQGILGVDKQGYFAKFSIWDRDIREIMEKEYRWEDVNWIN